MLVGLDSAVTAAALCFWVSGVFLGFIAVLVRVVGLSCFRICLLDLVLCGVGIIYHSCALVLFCGFDTGWLSGWVDCGDVDLRWVCCVGGFGVL